jgi:hypothetical protein
MKPLPGPPDDTRETSTGLVSIHVEDSPNWTSDPIGMPENRTPLFVRGIKRSQNLGERRPATMTLHNQRAPFACREAAAWIPVIVTWALERSAMTAYYDAEASAL